VQDSRRLRDELPEFTGTSDLRSYLTVLWRWKLLFVVVVVATVAVAYLLQLGSPKTYRSSALVGVNQTTVDSSLITGGGSFSTSNVTAIAELVTTTPVARVAAGLMHPPASPGQIVGEVSATGDTTTNFVTISAEDRSPRRAAAIANAFAKAISFNQQQSAIAQLRHAIRGIKAQLARVSDPATRAALHQQLSQLQAARFTQGSDAAVLQAATPSGTPTGLGTRRALEIGLVIGLLLGLGAVVLAESADRRLRTPDDLEGMTELPLLATIAPSAFSDKLVTSHADDEAFNLLRTALMYFNIDRRLESVIITSPGEKDGKTTVAARLALAVTSSGVHVILVDADLRRRQASARMRMQGDAGLGGVLSGSCSLEDALVDYPVADARGGRLTVLPAGPPPSNPSALLSSEAMVQVLRELESQSDLVIIDTPAALAVSDPLPLMRLVSGVVVVARMNRSRRHSIRRVQRMIESAHGTLLGVVATGVSAAPGYEHYTSKYYAHNGANGANGKDRTGRLRMR
jgi:tyrosine-protein kinase